MNKTVHKELRSLSHLIFRTIENRSNKKKIESMSGNNGCIIGYLSDNRERDVFQRDLEKEFGITRSTASKVVNLMEQKGLVRKEGIYHNRYGGVFKLTEKGMSAAGQVRRRASLAVQIAGEDLSDENRAVFYESLEKIASKLRDISKEGLPQE